jgi:hypothetical protein
MFYENHLFITWLISKKYHAITNDNKYGLKIDKTIRKKLVGTKDRCFK